MPGPAFPMVKIRSAGRTLSSKIPHVRKHSVEVEKCGRVAANARGNRGIDFGPIFAGYDTTLATPPIVGKRILEGEYLTHRTAPPIGIFKLDNSVTEL
jgi:hypothetical protein